MKWFTSWLQSRRKPAAADNAVAGRCMYEYWDGTQTRYADPFLVWRELLKHEPVDVLASWEDAMAGKEPIATQVLERICGIFSVKPWDEATKTGLTGWELLALVQSFELFVLALKKNGNPTPTPSAPTDSTGSTPQADRGETTPTPPSDYGSTPAE